MKTYLVGGAVRDELLNRPVTEKDWVVTGATEQMMLKRGFTRVGKDFPVFLHPQTKDEHALARLEKKDGKGYTGFVCDAGPKVTLEEDLLRRDLTINAMAKDADGQIIDPYNGQQDLAARNLRHVSAAFSEDPLRVFRVARFAARYHKIGFTVAPETQTLMQQMVKSGMLSELTAERVWQETRRAVMEDHAPVFFEVLNSAGGLNDWFGELTPFTCEQVKPLKLACKSHAELPVRMACITALITPAQTQALIGRLKCPNSVSELALLAAQYCQVLLSAPNAQTLLDTFNRCDVWRRPERFGMLLDVTRFVGKAQLVNWPVIDIYNAMTAAGAVNVQQIIAAGHQGAQIKTALANARLHAIEKILSN